MRLLVVEDDPDLNRQLVTALSDAGYAVDTAFDGEEGHFLGDTEPYDAVDPRSRPAQDRRLERARAVAPRRPQDAGADPRPRATGGATRSPAWTPAPTTMWRSPSTWRRCWRAFGRWCGAPPAMPSNEIECGPLRLDTKSARVTVDGQPVKLTSHEYRLLAYLMHHNGPRGVADRAGRASLRAGLRPRLQHGRSFHRTPAQEASRRHHQDRPRARLPPRGRRPMRPNSLAFRLFASAAAWTLVVLPVTAFLLLSLYRQARRAQFRCAAQRLPDEPRRLDHGGGRRARRQRRPISASRRFTHSLVGRIGKSTLRPTSRFARLAPRAARRRQPATASRPTNASQAALSSRAQDQRALVEREIRPPRAIHALFLCRGRHAAEIERDLAEFPHDADRGARRARARSRGWRRCSRSASACAPLRAIGHDLAAIRSGDAERLEGELPAEIRPLQQELNALDPIQPRDRRPGAHPCRQSRACAQDAAQRHHQ